MTYDFPKNLHLILKKMFSIYFFNKITIYWKTLVFTLLAIFLRTLWSFLKDTALHHTAYIYIYTYILYSIVDRKRQSPYFPWRQMWLLFLRFSPLIKKLILRLKCSSHTGFQILNYHSLFISLKPTVFFEELGSILTSFLLSVQGSFLHYRPLLLRLFEGFRFPQNLTNWEFCSRHLLLVTMTNNSRSNLQQQQQKCCGLRPSSFCVH